MVSIPDPGRCVTGCCTPRNDAGHKTWGRPRADGFSSIVAVAASMQAAAGMRVAVEEVLTTGIAVKSDLHAEILSACTTHFTDS